MKAMAHGTKLRMEDPSTPGTYITIAHIKDITIPSSTADLVEVTDQDSPNGRKEFIGGLKDSAELTFALYWDAENTTHEMVEDRVGETHGWEIELNNAVATKGTYYRFDAVIRTFAGKAPVAGPYEADLTLKPSGDVAKTNAT